MEKLRNQTGVGLLEVLIALFVLSVGLLGVASLQFVASKSNHDALMRSQALIAAEQLAESMRANAEYINRNNASENIVNPVTDNFYTDASNYNFTNLTCGTSVISGTKWDCFCEQLPASIPQCRDEDDDSDICTPELTAIYDAYDASCNVAKVGDALTLEVQCDDNNSLDADACSAHSIHRIFVRWPVTGWKGLEVTTNSRCSADVGGTDTNHQCVVLDVVLGG